MKIPGRDERWENWMQFVQSRMMRRFTNIGFTIAQTPPYIQQRLLQVVENAINNWDELDYEYGVDEAIYNKYQLKPKMIPTQDLWNEIHEELLPMHEKWSNTKYYEYKY